MKRLFRLTMSAAALVSMLGWAGGGPAAAFARIPSDNGYSDHANESVAINGQIAFMRYDVAAADQFVYTANPDGSHERLVVPYPAERPHWSPDGSELLFLCCDAANVLNMATGAITKLTAPAGLFFGCLAWTRDGARLLCEGFGDTDTSLNGIYSMRASDGGDVRRITVNPDGDDIPQATSPDGSEIVFVSDRDSTALFVVNLDGTDVRRLDTGGLLDISSASWSPDGNWILFPARKAPGQRRSLFLIHPNGSGLHDISMNPPCGGQSADRSSRGCLDPVWSPDGSRILFAILPADNLQKRLYTVNPDGSHLIKVTRRGFVHGDPGEGDQAPDWGTHPLQ